MYCVNHQAVAGSLVVMILDLKLTKRRPLYNTQKHVQTTNDTINKSADNQTKLAEQKNMQLEMWANAQRDGRPAEYRWRPLFNAPKFG